MVNYYQLFMKSIYLILAMLMACAMGNAQENPLPKIHIRNFTDDLKKTDTTAHAVVLFEHGRTELQYVEGDEQLMIVHVKHVRIKILDKEGFDEANVKLRLYKSGNEEEYIKELKGRTLNYENGQVQETEMKREAVFNEKASQYANELKFTLPNIKENSIIEYSYRLYSPFIRNFRTWYFQSNLPKLHSEYVAVIPATFDYNVSMKGYYGLTEQKDEILREHFLYGGNRQDCSKLIYIMKDIPAFKDEGFMLAPINYISSINFELRSYTRPAGGVTNFAKTWANIDEELMADKDFGGQIKNKGAFKELLPTMVDSATTNLAKAKNIYYYIQDHIAWNEVGGKYAEKGIKKALAEKKGNIADINLALVAAMNAADIEAYPVIFSHRTTGIPGLLYPVLTDFNGVLCMVKIDGKDYLLDASVNMLPFGELSLESINYKGRVIYSKGKSDWVDLVNTTPSKNIYNVLAVLDSTGKITGTLRIQSTGLKALAKRNTIDEYPSLEEYEEKLMENSGNFRIKKSKVDNLNNLEKSLFEELTFEIDLRDNFNDLRYVLNPMIYNRITKNPFTLEQRNYPVDLGAEESELYNFNFTLPNGYVLKDKPKDISMTLPEQAAKYTFKSAIEGNNLMIQQQISMNKAIYTSDEYFFLKELYARIIQQQQKDFQFAKQ